MQLSRLSLFVCSILMLHCLFSGMSSAGSITCRGPNYYPSDDELEFSLASAAISDDFRLKIIGDDRIHLNVCASKLRYSLCTDGLIMGILSPRDSLIGAGIGGVFGKGDVANRIITGSMLGGIAGTISGVVTLGMCNKYLEEQISPIANKLKKVQPGKATLSLFMDTIDESVEDKKIKKSEAEYLKAEIQKWVKELVR